MIRIEKLVLPAVFVVLTATTAVFSGDRQWGDLCGRFIYCGNPPKANTITVTKDNEAVGGTIPDESLVVNPCNRGLGDVLVYLLPKEGVKLSVHPTYKNSAR